MLYVFVQIISNTYTDTYFILYNKYNKLYNKIQHAHCCILFYIVVNSCTPLCINYTMSENLKQAWIPKKNVYNIFIWLYIL